MLRFPRWNSQESFSTPPRISYVRVLKGSRAFYPIPRAASLLPRIFSLSLFIFLFLSLSSSLCIALLANPLDEEYARLPPSYSFLLATERIPDLEWDHSRVSRKNHISASCPPDSKSILCFECSFLVCKILIFSLFHLGRNIVTR